jgi:hypothetical protein
MSRVLAWSDERTNASALDEWSLVHFGLGLALGAFGANAWLFVLGNVAYEAAELAHESPSGSSLFGTKRPEWDVNMVTDLSVAFGGYVIGRLLRGDQAPR